MSHSIQNKSTVLLFVLIALAILTSFHTYPYDNVVTRWALTRQVVDKGSIRIDPYVQYTSDRALSEGNYYCDKAVLTSLFAAVPYGASKAISSITGLHPSPGLKRYIAERLVTGASLILLLLIIRRFLKKKGYSTFLPLLALGAGSILLPYSTLLYGHVPAAFFIFMSWYFQQSKRYALADLTGALAAAIEFPVLLIFLVLLVYRGRSNLSVKKIARTAGFLVLAFLPQLLHNWAAFGNPLTMGYSLETAEAFEGMSEGLFGFTLPSIRSLYLLVLSPERGLLFYMPWITLGFWGFFSGKRFFTVLKNNPLPIIMISYTVLFSAYYMPTGGWAYGPRHLIPVIPFTAVGLADFVKKNSKRKFTALVLILPSILIALIGVFGEIHQPVHPVENPLPIPQWNIGLQMMLKGHHSLWLLGSIGTIAISSSLLLLWGSFLRKTRISWPGFAILGLWVLLILFSSMQDWGGRIDYYRGVLAQHREEWALAVYYYEKAASDPSAPDIVIERAEYCRGRIRPRQ
ncbi:MAG: hypothetical protein GF388_00990 [Candidatus Aegiribacteria sp.]|nr:hypothetical protein [Candidatus Aegiribacteria sp.]MBD3293981.1 hypothetical protein [Candidatus Fermentibacteria bacterium]